MPERSIAAAGRQIADVWQGIRSVPRRLRTYALDRVQDRANRQQYSQPSVADRREQLAEFYQRYEDLVDILCGAARYGPDPSLEAKYGVIRSWMMRCYTNIRPYAVAYLMFDETDASQSLALHGYGGDAFEALFAATTLEEFLRVDDGLMMSRIARTREALNLYGEHLRQLAEAA